MGAAKLGRMDEESVRRGASDGMYSWLNSYEGNAAAVAGVKEGTGGWLNTYEGNAAVVAGVKEAISGWLAGEGAVIIGQVVREYLDENGLGGDQT